MKVASAVLINADTGKVLYSYNGDQALPPASMSKMMTELIVLEAISQTIFEVHLPLKEATTP